MTTDEQLTQIKEIAQNARATWFGLLALLVFVGVTLMGHEDRDFFAYGAATQLPLVGIEVPPTAFFIAAPILTAAVYCYLHVYLLGLWEALGRITQAAQAQAVPLSDRVYPILFINAALWYRNRIRRDDCFRERALGRWTLSIAILMGWGFGWVILFLLWWRSMPLHHEGLTLLIGLSFWITIFFGAHSLWAAHSYLRDRDYQHIRHFSWPEAVLSVTLLVVVSAVGWLRTEGGFEEYVEDPWIDSELTAKILPLYPTNLAEAELTRKPSDWLDFEDWKKEYALKFRERYGLGTNLNEWPEDRRSELAEEVPNRWRALTQGLEKISLRGADLRRSNLEGAFIVGADLRDVRLGDANLTRAQMEGADLSFARLSGANLWSAQMEEVNLAGANLDNANLVAVRIDQRILQTLRTGGADLRGSVIDGSDCGSLMLFGALLHDAVLNCTDGTLSGWDLRFAVGNSKTVLPKGLSVESCFSREKPHVAARYDELKAALNWVVPNGYIPAKNRGDGPTPVFCDAALPRWSPH